MMMKVGMKRAMMKAGRLKTDDDSRKIKTWMTEVGSESDAGTEMK